MDAFACSSSEALARLETNPSAHWSSGWGNQPGRGTAWQRLTAGDFFTPMIRSEFELRKTDRIFAVGSCFARRVELALRDFGFAVESITDSFDRFTLRREGAWPPGFANKYTPHAILNELRWALEPEHEFPAEALQQRTDGTCVDVQAHYAVFEDVDLETTLARHRLLTQLVSKIRLCRVVILTLGLVESFFDTATSLYANATPDLTAAEDRFRFQVLGVGDVVDALENIHTLLDKWSEPNLEIVVTVSPVPLAATFTGQDVVLANSFSKAVLRAAAGSWAAMHENVHYFPAYEMVMSTPSDRAWLADGRHVRQPLVEHIMKAFVQTHAPSLPPGV